MEYVSLVTRVEKLSYIRVLNYTIINDSIKKVYKIIKLHSHRNIYYQITVLIQI